MAITPIAENPKYADVDHMFCNTNDEDYDNGVGVSCDDTFFDSI